MQRRLSIMFVLSLVSYPLRVHTNNFYQTFFSKNNLVFDVGANIGAKTEEYLALGARVVCIEPQPDCCNKLHTRFKYNSNVIIVETALGEKPDILELFVCSSSNTISTFSREWVEESRHSAIGYKWDKKIYVPVTTLDLLIKQFGVPQFCKIDVENYEFEVLKGLSVPIPCLSFEFAIEVMHNTKKCLSRLGEIGYQEFNVTFEETPKLCLDHWVSAEELVAFIYEKSKTIDKIWGDIYARHLVQK